MTRWLIRRLAGVLVTLWVLATLGFLLVELIPGDPARQLAGPIASNETVERIRHVYGFDRPIAERYVSTIGRYVVGDLGDSFSRSEPVRSVIARGIPRTLSLAGLAFIGEIALGIPLAMFVTGSRRGRRRIADASLVLGASATAAIPTFLLGLILLYLFAFRLHWFPLGGDQPLLALGSVLPALTVAVPYGLVLGRILRTSLLEELEKPYVRFAVSRGESLRRIRWRHVLPNALLPLFSLLALDFAGLFATVAVVEVVFSMQGLGSDLFTAIRRLDTSLIVGIAVVAGVVVATVNLLADLAVLAVDPRVRRSELT